MEQVLTPASATVKTTAVVTGQSEAEVAPASPVAPDQQPIEPDQQSSGASREAELLEQQQLISGASREVERTEPQVQSSVLHHYLFLVRGRPT